MESVQRRSFKVGGKPERPSTYNPLDPVVQALAAEEDAEHRRNMRIGLVVAAFFHIALLIVSIPEPTLELEAAGRRHEAYVMQQVRFKPPPARPKEQIKKKKKAKKIPIPDPTPDDPEPLIREIEEPELPDSDFDGIEGLAFIPDSGPPGPGSGAVAVGGDISAPIKIFSPQPQYTEDARQARVQGVVILRTVVDTEGEVVNVKILKGLPGGLTESAMETVSQWKFKPALQRGKPVAVYFLLTISFSLQ